VHAIIPPRVGVWTPPGDGFVWERDRRHASAWGRAVVIVAQALRQVASIEREDEKVDLVTAIVDRDAWLLSDEDRGAAFHKIVPLHERGNGPGDFLTPDDRWLNRVGVVDLRAADQP
jgi:hypothetical protein